MSISDFAISVPEPEKPATEWKEDSNKEVETEAPKVEAPSIQAPTTPAPTISLGSPAPSAAESVDDILADVMDAIGDTIGDSANLKVMVYGDPGSFKSSFLATAPDNLIIDLEDGLISAKHSPHGVAENVRPYRWRGFDHWRKTVGLLHKAPPELDWVKVVSIDTFSEMHKRQLQAVLMEEKRKRPSFNEFDPQTEHYAEANERMLRMLRALKDLDRDLIISTHARTVEPKNKAAKTYADFSESLSNKIMALMDVVGYCEKRKVDGKIVMAMNFMGDGQFHAKQRIGLPDELINPTYADIKQAWEESKNK